MAQTAKGHGAPRGGTMENDDALGGPSSRVHRRRAVRTINTKIMADVRVMVTGTDPARIDALSAGLAAARLGTVTPQPALDEVIQSAVSDQLDIAIFLSGMNPDPAYAFVERLRSAERNRRVVMLLGHPESALVAKDGLYSGFDAVLGADAPARVFYRTIASLVQNARRKVTRLSLSERSQRGS